MTMRYVSRPTPTHARAGPANGPVADRDRRHAFRREHELIAVARGQPVHHRRRDEQHDVDPEALPRRCGRASGAATGGHDAVGSGVASRGHGHGQAGDGDADGGGHHRPDDRRGRRGAEPGRPEGDAADERGDPETDARAEDADDERFDGGEADELARRRAACAQQGVLAAPRVGAGRGDRGGEQPGEHHAGRGRGQEQHLGVQRVARGRRRASPRGCRRRSRRRRGRPRGVRAAPVTAVYAAAGSWGR